MNRTNEVSIIQNTPDWYDWRRTRLGASDAPIVCNVSPWKSRQTLLDEKSGKILPPEPNEAMIRGSKMEEQARAYIISKYQQHFGRDVVFRAACFHLPENDRIIASIDAWSDEFESAYEIKCPGERTHEHARKNIISEVYEYQMQHQMWVLGLEWIYYFSYRENDPIRIKYFRDDAIIAHIQEHAISFLQELHHLKQD